MECGVCREWRRMLVAIPIVPPTTMPGATLLYVLLLAVMSVCVCVCVCERESMYLHVRV